MIRFNSTLIIQMGNFVVSWWVLDRFFFKRCVAEVHKEQQVLQTLEQAVIDQKFETESLEKMQHDSLKKTQDNFAQALPSVAPISPKIISTHAFVFLKECDVSTQQIVAREMASSLVKRITHV